ncbi:MAG: NAD(P)H-dependent oxidoreductase [Clostridia bacterium]|nr:NAD(P)H-dependent oxidoreductase [Clostridia bacterium]
MKKPALLIMAAIVIFMLFLFSACSSGTQSGESPSAAEAETSAAAADESAAALNEEKGDADDVIEDSNIPSPNEESPDLSYNDDPPAANANDKVLIAYFTRAENIDLDPETDAVASASINISGSEASGNAKLLSDMVSSVVRGDVFSIRVSDKYPKSYSETTDIAKKELSEGTRRALSSHVENMDEYGTIILIYPCWWGSLPGPVSAFLDEYDFSGKTILPLCTSGGGAMGDTQAEIEAACPASYVREGIVIRGDSIYGSESVVADWLTREIYVD